MPIIDAHEGDLQRASDDMVQRPAPPRRQAPRFSTWGMLTAAPKGLAAGAADVFGSTADVLGAFGQALATTEPSAGGMFSLPTERERRENADATDKLRREGLDSMSEGGRSFRNVSRDYLPDPATAHAAEQAVGELFRIGGKALTAAAVMGPLAGAAVAGAEEGFSTADRLAQQGVDLDTRTAVGAVTAAIQAGTFALPVAGKTWPQTIGLALAGGPASFVGQQAATRWILQEQDYSLLADRYDPTDPVGLTLSTVLPFGVGALGMRAAARKAAASSPEAVDAARTALLAEQQAAARPVPAEDLAGAAAHEQAVSRAMDQMAAGERVEVTDMAPAAGAERIRAHLEERLRPLRAAMDEQLAAEPAPVSELPPVLQLFHGTKDPEVTVDGLSRTLDIGPHFTTERATAELFANSEGTPGRVLEAHGQFAKSLELPDLNSWFPTTMAEAIDAAHGVKPGTDGQTPLQAQVWAAMERARLEHLNAQPEWYQQARNDFGSKPAEQLAQERAIQAAANDKANEAGYQVLREHLAEKGYDSIKYLNRNEGAPVDTYIALDRSKVRDASQPPAEPPAAVAKPAEGNALPVEDPALDARATALEQQAPDMLVQLEGMEAKAPLREVMARLRREVADDLQEAPLIRTAAECFLSTL